MKLAVIAIAQYYCHLLGFGISAVICLAYIIVSKWHVKKMLYRQSLLCALSFSPGIVMALLFVLNIHVPFYDYDFSPYEKSLALITFHPGIVFEKKEETPYTILISVILIVLSTLIFASRTNPSERFKRGDIFLILSLSMIYLIFHSKNGDLGGMFTDRQLCLCFYFLTLWVCSHANFGLMLPVSFLIALIEFGNVSLIRYEVSAKAQKEIADIIAVRKFVREKTVVKTVGLSARWFNSHISCYLGIGKEVVLLENYEAYLGWFPLSWNQRVRNNLELKKEESADYVLIYGNDKSLQYRLHDTLPKSLAENFHLVHQSSDKFCKLYERK